MKIFINCCCECGIVFKSRSRILLSIKTKLHKLKH